MANDDHSGGDGGGTWDASRSVDDVAEAHRTGGTSALGPSSPPGDIGPFANRKVGHFTQTDAGTPPVPTRVGATSLVEFEAGRSLPPMPPKTSAPHEPVTVQRRGAGHAGPGNHLDWASGGPLPEAQVHAQAAEGIAGPGSPVPYRAELARSLGPQAAPMLDRISVHQDERAQASSAAIGATAFAAGDHIALPASPSLHLVAHEVAHVAQQAEGVHLSGGVGQEGDPHERAADAFADAVVAGEPVPFAGGAAGGTPPSTARVQRRAASDAHGPDPRPGDAASSASTNPAGESAPEGDAAAGLDEMEPWQLVVEVGQPGWTPARAVAIDHEVRARTQRMAKQSGDAVGSGQRAGGLVDGLADALQLEQLMKPAIAIHSEVLGRLSLPVAGTNRAALAAYVGWFADAHARWVPAHAALKAWLLDKHLWEDVNGSGTTGGTRESPGLGAIGAVNAAMYATTHATAIAHATSRYLQSVPWTPVHARLAWRDAHGFAQEVSRELAIAWGDLSSPEMLHALADAVRPADALKIIDEMRPMVSEGAPDRGNAFRGGALGSSVWQASIGVAIAQLVHSAVVESARRLGTRWVAAADAAHRSAPTVATGIGIPDLAPSSPLDAQVARALTEIDIVGYSPPSADAPAEPAPKRHERVSVAWQGSTSPSLWNWVKANPPDATAEEVSTALWQDSHRAHALIGAAPLFGVPPEWAREFKEASAHAPAQPVPFAPSSSQTAAPEGVLAAADSSAASEIALHQAPAAAPDTSRAVPKSPAVTRAMEAIGESRTDLVFLATVFAGWGRADATGVALKFLEAKSIELTTADDATATTWLRVLEAQRSHLATLARLVHDVSASAAKLGMTDPRDPAAAPLREIIDVLAQAAGASHLAETCAVQISKAGRLLDNLALEALRGTMRASTATVDQSRTAAHEDRESHRSAIALDQVNVDAERLQADMVAGAAVDADELADVTLRAEEIALDAKLHGLLVELLDLEHAMEVDGFFEWAASEMSASFLPTARAIPGLRGELMTAQEYLRPDGATSPAPGAAHATATRHQRQRALAQARAAYAGVQSKHDLGEFLREGATLVKWQQVRTACLRVATMIGVGIVAGAAAGAAGKAVAGMFGAGEGGAAVAAELSMAGRLAKSGAEVVADATVNTTGMAVSSAIDRTHPARSTTGPAPAPEEDSLGASALNNLLFSIANKGVVEPLARDLASLEQAEVVAVTRWEKAGAMARAAPGELAAISGHAILGAAIGHVTHVFGKHAFAAPPATLEEWLLQGASIAVGRAIGQRAAARAARMAKVRMPESLVAQTKAIATDARALETGKGGEAKTLELMAREHAALEGEAQALEEIRTDPVKLAASGLRWEEAAALGAQARAGLGNDHAVAVAAIQFRLAGLEEAVPGALWRGSHDDVVHALAMAREASVEVKATHDPDAHRWGVEIDGQKVSILETIAAEGTRLPSATAKERTPADATGSEAANVAARTGTAQAGQTPTSKIRDATELSNEDVARDLNAQLQPVTADDVDALIEKFPPSQRAHARTVLARASGYGNMESMNSLRVAMQPFVEAGRSLYVPGRGSLADNLAYVDRHGAFKNVPGAGGMRIEKTPIIDPQNPRTLVILDDVVLQQIRTDPEFAQLLVDTNAILLEPHGFNAGLTMFNTGTPEQTGQRAAALLTQSQALYSAKKGAMTFEAAVDAVLQQPVHDALAGANPELLGQLTVVAASDHADVSSATIGKQMSGNAGVSPEEVQGAFDEAGLTPEQQKYARELLAQQAEVLSARSLAQELEVAHHSAMAKAAQRGVSPENVYFYIPLSDKSFGMLAMAHRQATGTPVERYIDGAADLEGRGLGPETLLVVLDDVAGSGQSLAAAVSDARGAGYEGAVIVAPMVSTEVARDLLADGRSTLQAGRMASTLRNSEFYKSLSEEQQEILLAVAGGGNRDLGWGPKDDDGNIVGNALSMAFPYMAPDNNNHFFGEVLAKFFIMNRNKKASKSRPYAKPSAGQP